METTRALLLRKTKLTETSLIVTWFTASFGLIKTVAKGARNPKSKFAGGLDLFFDCEIQFSRSRHRPERSGMLPLAGSQIPASPEELATALQEGFRKHGLEIGRAHV